MVLVVQFRQDVTEQHEQECISRYLAADRQVRFVSVFDETLPWAEPHEMLRGITKVILGGSAGISMAEGHDDVNYGQVEYILGTMAPLLRHILAEDISTLGTCFGHHLLAHFAGGGVVFDPEMAETGYHEIVVNEDEVLDPILAGVPHKFLAVVGHQDSVVGLPPEVKILASSDRCATQALRYGQNVYSTQYHSELLAADLIYRVNLFPQYRAYANTLEPTPTPYGVTVLKNFLAL